VIRPGFHRGRLWHRRQEPSHAFSRDLLLAVADVDAIDAAPEGELALAGRWPISLRRADHLPVDPQQDGAEATLRRTVARIVAARTGRTPTGPMFLVSQPRCFGLTFDPVSFVYCLSGDGVEAVVAEVTNTPWGERIVYVLADLEETATGRLRCTMPKEMHVSPFFGMDHDYVFEIGVPGERLGLSITNHRSGRRVFEAGFDLRRIRGFDGAPSSGVLRHAFIPYETLFGIYVQAARLAWKRAPFHPHPSRRGMLTPSEGPPLDSGGTQ